GERHQYRKTRWGRGPAVRGHPLAELPGFVMRPLRLLGLLVLLGALGCGYAIWRTQSSYQGFAGETFVEFPRGSSTGVIADKLAAAGVVRSRWDFMLARMLNRGKALQAGEYRFAKPASAADVVGRIQRGDIFYYELVVPEGRNMFDIGAAVE